MKIMSKNIKVRSTAIDEVGPPAPWFLVLVGRLPLFCLFWFLFFPGLSVIPEKLCTLRLYYEADQ